MRMSDYRNRCKKEQHEGKTYWNGNTSSSTKSSLANIRVCLKLRITVQTGTQEQPSIKWNNCKKKQHWEPKPSTFFRSIRGRKDSNTTKNIYAYKIQTMMDKESCSFKPDGVKYFIFRFILQFKVQKLTFYDSGSCSSKFIIY